MFGKRAQGHTEEGPAPAEAHGMEWIGTGWNWTRWNGMEKKNGMNWDGIGITYRLGWNGMERDGMEWDWKRMEWTEMK